MAATKHNSSIQTSADHKVFTVVCEQCDERVACTVYNYASIIAESHKWNALYVELAEQRRVAEAA